MEHFQFTSIAILYGVAFLLSFFLFFFVLSIKHVQGKMYFAFMMLSIAIWIFGYSMGFFSTRFPFKLFMLRVEYLGIISTFIFWLFFVSAFSGHEKWLTGKVRILISIIPLITYIQLLFVDHHQFFYLHYGLKEYKGLVITDKIYGPGFYIWVVYSYLLMLLSVYILIRSLVRMSGRFRRYILPNVLVVVSVIVPNALYITGNNPINPYDPICLSFLVVAIIYIYIMQQQGFLDLAPVAHNMVFKNVNIGVLVINKFDIIVDANPVSEEILDKNTDELVGEKIEGTIPLFSKLLPDIKSKKDFKTEIEIPHKQKVFEFQSNIMTDYRGRNNGHVLMFYDITRRKRALEELDAYARTVAHNLKNPMSALSGFAEILMDQSLTSEARVEYLSYIRESSAKMNSIIDGLLLLSQIRSSKEIKAEPLDMNHITGQVMDRLEYMIDSNSAKVEYPAKWPEALGYSIWIEEIWVNYIINAVKYGGDPPYIQLGADVLDRKVKFWVKDNGVGVREEEKDMLFREFTRLEKKGSNEGFGLGLSIVKRIVKKLNGECGVESTLGKGSTFYFTLRRA